MNFFLPIPIGGLAYVSLRFSGVGWRDRLRTVRNEVSVEPTDTTDATGATETPADRTSTEDATAVPDATVAGDGRAGPAPGPGPGPGSSTGRGIPPAGVHRWRVRSRQSAPPPLHP